jgi:hypothetical protein
MSLPLGAIAASLVKGYARSRIRNAVVRSTSKKYIRSKSSKAIQHGKYRAYKSRKTNLSSYSLEKLYRDIKTAERIFRVLTSKSLLGMITNTRSVYGSISSKVKFSGYVRSFTELQQKYRMNFFDRIVFNISQRNEGVFNKEILLKDNYLREIFGDTRTYMQISGILNEYIDKKTGIFEHLGFINNRNGFYEVTETYLAALGRSGMLDRDIESFKEGLRGFDPGKYYINVLEAAIADDSLNIDNILKIL